MTENNENYLAREIAAGEEKLAHTQPASPKKTLLGIGIILLVVAGVLLLLKAIQPSPPVGKKQEKVWLVDVIEATPGAHRPQLHLLGNTESPATSVLTAGITADVRAVLVEEGNTVQKGQLMIQLDDSEARLVLAQRTADVADIQAQIEMENISQASNQKALAQEKALVEIAEKAVEREKRLQKSNVTSAANLDNAQRVLEQQRLALQQRTLTLQTHAQRLAQLKARLQRAEALKALAEQDLARTRVLAPFDGVITNVRVAAGERVRTSDPLVTLFDRARMEIRAQIPQAHLPFLSESLRTGTPLSATVHTPFGNFTATLDRLSGSANAGTGGIDGLFRPDTPPDGLPLNQTADLTLELPPIPASLLIPVSSLYGTERVYYIEEGRLKGVDVQRWGTRTEQGRQWLLIASDAIPPGAKIITTQLPTAVNGLKVRARNEGAANE